MHKAVAGLILGVSLLWATPASPQGLDLPILFIHGFCSDSGTWEFMINHMVELDPARYRGSQVPLFYDGTQIRSLDGHTYSNADPSRRRLFTIDFYDGVGRSWPFAPTLVNNIDSYRKAFELRHVIQEVKRISGQDRVILIGHSLGGLIARAYVEGLARDLGPSLPFLHDVFGIVTIDSPHSGSDLAHLSFDPLGVFGVCAAPSSVNKSELEPHSAFLNTLNSVHLPDDVVLASVSSWGFGSSNYSKVNGDGIVSYVSQNMASIPFYSQDRAYEVENVFRSDDPCLLSLDPACGHLSVHKTIRTFRLINDLLAYVPPVPTPTITSISPPSITVGSFSLTVNGTGFDPQTVQIVATGPECPTAVCVVPNSAFLAKSDRQLILPATLRNPGTYTIQAQNGSNGALSNAGTILVTASVPTTPTITTVSPITVAVGSFALTINGTGFDPSSAQIVVTGPGCPNSTSCVIPNGVLTMRTTTRLVGPATLANQGTYTTKVQNGSGGTLSNAATIVATLTVPSAPTITSIAPTGTTVGSFSLTINGNGFNPSLAQVVVTGPGCSTASSCVVPNGVLTTRAVTQLVAPVTLANAGTYTIQVQNGSGGVLSNGTTLIVSTSGTCTTAPSQPTRLVSSVIGATVTLTWSPVSSATSYLVQIETLSGATVGSDTTNGTSYMTSLAAAGSGHYIAWIRATNSCGVSARDTSVHDNPAVIAVNSSACVFDVSPPAVTAPSFGGANASTVINVTTGPSCYWTASSNSDFIFMLSTFTPGTDPSNYNGFVYKVGSGGAYYFANCNAIGCTQGTGLTRTGSVTVAGHSVTVTQPGL